VAAAEFRESCSAAVGAAGGTLILQAVRLAARWPACCLPAHPRAPYGPYGRERACSGEGAGWPTGRSRMACQKRNRSRVKIGRHTKYNTRLSPPPSSLPTHHAYIQTHPPLPPQGCTMGPSMWPWRSGLMARPVSGVEWCGSIFPVQLLGLIFFLQLHSKFSLSYLQVLHFLFHNSTW